MDQFEDGDILRSEDGDILRWLCGYDIIKRRQAEEHTAHRYCSDRRDGTACQTKQVQRRRYSTEQRVCVRRCKRGKNHNWRSLASGTMDRARPVRPAMSLSPTSAFSAIIIKAFHANISLSMPLIWQM